MEQAHYRGDWAEALDQAAMVPDASGDSWLSAYLARIEIDRGAPDRARVHLDRLPGDTETTDVQVRIMALWRRRLTAELEGRFDDANGAILEILIDSPDLMPAPVTAEAIRDAATYATLTRDHDGAKRIAARVDGLPATIHVRSVDSQLHRLRANAGAAAGDEQAAADGYSVALANARSLDYAFWLAPVLHDYGAWLVSTGRPDEAAPLLTEARELFERMGATTWIQRLDAIAPAVAAQAAAGAAST